jgi:glutamate-5-semialdehyde dehydrogenase
LPAGWAQLIEGRQAVAELLNYHEYVDLVIPRGSNALVQHIMANTRIPVLGHADGVCHLYVHTSADIAKTLSVVLDAKTQYPSACNALETLLLDATLAETFLPMLSQAALAAGLTLLGCDQTRQILRDLAPVESWHTEYGELKLSVKLVGDVSEAICHINRYGSHHTDGILASDPSVIETFLTQVDSANVYANASTRFADGFRYGLGAEIGISTSRTHARGPVGLQGLVTTQYRLIGEYHTVAPYSSGNREFQHRVL